MSATVFIQLPVTRASASDHIDSPIIAQDHRSDSADLRAFFDPNDSSKIVSIKSTQDFIVSGDAKADPTQPFPPGSGADDKTRQ